MTCSVKQRVFLDSIVLIWLAGLLFGAAAPVVQAEERAYILATAAPGGTYYPVGIALATLVQVKLKPQSAISLSAIPSSGSGENIRLLRENRVQFALLQGLYGAWAWNGAGPFQSDGPQQYLRSITLLWRNVEHFTILSDAAKTGTLEDLHNLKGQRFAMGEQGSGAAGSSQHILNSLGIDPERDFKPVYLSYELSAKELQAGNLQGMSTPAGIPVTAVTQAFAALGRRIALLDFTAEQLQRVNGQSNLWTRFVIPANTYPGQSRAVNTIAQPNFLAVRDDIDAETVYLITKTLYENLRFLSNIHKATRAMSLASALEGLSVPLHPGAARYYREVGLAIPEPLSAGQ